MMYPIAFSRALFVTDEKTFDISVHLDLSVLSYRQIYLMYPFILTRALLVTYKESLMCPFT